MIVWLVRFLFRHPVVVLAVVDRCADVAGDRLARPGLVLAVSITAGTWRCGGGGSRPRSPASSASPARGQWRAWHYRRRWAAVMTIGRLAPVYQGRVLLPVLGKVSATRFTDRVQVRLVSGQSAADFAAGADNLAHGFGAHAVPDPLRLAGCAGAGVRPPRRPGRHHPRPGASRPGWTCGRCRSAAAKTAMLWLVRRARHARADRRAPPGREGLAAVVDWSGHAPGHGGRAGPRSGPPIPS